MLMAPRRSYCALAILLAFVDIQSGGCINITSLVSQEGKQLKLICTVWIKKEEAEGFVVFLCKDKSGDCSPETSLKQLRLKRDTGVDEKSSQLVFTINQPTPLDTGTYQCCARSQKPDIHLQGHFFSIVVTESGNYTVTRLKQRQHSKLSHNEGIVSSGFLHAKVWVMLVTSLVALHGMSKRCLSTPSNEGAIYTSLFSKEKVGREAQRERKMLKP
ncbi:CD160 antigen isoform X1 [Otolemur garnettii]|uniref:CD160 antigen isoform X1 n=1 Tax=Otolemur garnettii TaxID=30611 RepID=UPI000643EBD2|nr:CD160 antigen isoform X1 [Otolemur garnettii]